MSDATAIDTAVIDTTVIDNSVIELRGVYKDYPGDPPVPALHGIDLSVTAGELLAIVGPSGSGKSTLLHIIGTLDRPSRGLVRIASHDVAQLADAELSALRAHAIGFVFSSSSCYPG